MKVTIEQFDFTQLKPTDVLFVQLWENSHAHMQSARKTLEALSKSGKIPKGVFILIGFRDYSASLKTIPEQAMNAAGWYKMKPLQVTERIIENNPPQSPPDVPA